MEYKIHLSNLPPSLRLASQISLFLKEFGITPHPPESLQDAKANKGGSYFSFFSVGTSEECTRAIATLNRRTVPGWEKTLIAEPHQPHRPFNVYLKSIPFHDEAMLLKIVGLYGEVVEAKYHTPQGKVVDGRTMYAASVMMSNASQAEELIAKVNSGLYGLMRAQYSNTDGNSGEV